MMLARERKRHQQGCGPCAYDGLSVGNPDDKYSEEIERTTESYRGSTEHPRAADVGDTFSITSGCRIEIRNRRFWSCDPK
jgi:hypothetical protein